MSTALLQFMVETTSASSSEGGAFWPLALGPAGAAGVYWALFRYYRNTDKSQSFERETAIEAQPVTGADHKVDDVRGVRNSSISGDNVSHHRPRVNQRR